MYTSEYETKYAESFNVPLFTSHELQYGFKHMRKRRCADTDGIALQMCLYSGERNQHKLFE